MKDRNRVDSHCHIGLIAIETDMCSICNDNEPHDVANEKMKKARQKASIDCDLIYVISYNNKRRSQMSSATFN